jgi:hypothetical protein
MELVNQTPFAADTLLMLDLSGAETMAVVIKATYDVSGPAPRLAEKATPLLDADAYVGEPGKSSIRFASDRVMGKVATDVLLVGHAYHDRPRAEHVDVVLKVGPVRKVLRVFGNRVWTSGLLRVASAPAPFDRIPLVYERSFGGADDTAGERCAANPVGIGFRGKRSSLPGSGSPLPNIEDLRHLVQGPKDQPPVAGFGVIAPNWSPRLALAGTYDEAWLASRAPLPPANYDPRFQQTAPADQICPGFLLGGEPVEVRNASPRGRLAFALPQPRICVEVQDFIDRTPLLVKLDTVVIDGDRELLLMTWRGSLSVHGRVYEIDAVQISAEGEA